MTGKHTKPPPVLLNTLEVSLHYGQTGRVTQHSHAMYPLVDVDGVFPGDHLIDGRPPLLLLSSLLVGRHLEKGFNTLFITKEIVI